jgi:3-phosphoshikimate 1-carboxyvinyltransferase
MEISSDFLKVYPQQTKQLNSVVRIPSSKPETQRAILMASLAEGTSRIHNDLRCKETATMKRACLQMGVEIIERDDQLEIRREARASVRATEVIDCQGSGLVARCFLALGSVIQGGVIISGDNTLRNRPMLPLIHGLEQLGARIESICEPGKIPAVNWSEYLQGGRCVLPGNLSSQFITAVLIVAPLADTPVEIVVEGEVVSGSYIRQTLSQISKAGIKAEATETLDYFLIQPSSYQPINIQISGDFTSASYLFAVACLFPGTLVLQNLTMDSLQGERAIVDIVQALGIDIQFDNQDQCTLTNKTSVLRGDYHFDVKDCPNIVPTLATIGAYVEGTFRITGAGVTQLHKCPRIKAMFTELQKLGVNIQPLHRGEVWDGFEIKGKPFYEGGVKLSSWGDHRIFMSLFIATLRMKQPNWIDGFEGVSCSFPEFLEVMRLLGTDFYSHCGSMVYT